MGNSNIKETVDKHQELYEKILNNNLNENLIIFNIPITFDYYRQTKSYMDQIANASEDELANTTYNELYLLSEGIKITDSDVILMAKSELEADHIEILQTRDENNNEIRMYKHFDWINDDEPIPEIISDHVNKIIELQNKIKDLESQINTEKNKILNLDYVKTKLSKPVQNPKEYVKTIKYLIDKIYSC
jgi:hypothetical protein